MKMCSFARNSFNLYHSQLKPRMCMCRNHLFLKRIIFASSPLLSSSFSYHFTRKCDKSIVKRQRKHQTTINFAIVFYIVSIYAWWKHLYSINSCQYILLNVDYLPHENRKQKKMNTSTLNMCSLRLDFANRIFFHFVIRFTNSVWKIDTKQILPSIYVECILRIDCFCKSFVIVSRHKWNDFHEHFSSFRFLFENHFIKSNVTCYKCICKTILFSTFVVVVVDQMWKIKTFKMMVINNIACQLHKFHSSKNGKSFYHAIYLHLVIWQTKYDIYSLSFVMLLHATTVTKLIKKPISTINLIKMQMKHFVSSFRHNTIIKLRLKLLF